MKPSKIISIMLVIGLVCSMFSGLSVTSFADDTTGTEDTPTITSIQMTKGPTKTEYVEGQKFSTTGVTIYAYYSDETSKRVTSYTVSNTNALTLEDKKITLSGEYDSTAFSFDIDITVVPKVINKLMINKPNNDGRFAYSYLDGSAFEPNAMKVTVYYNDNTTKVLPVLDDNGKLNEGFTVTDTPLTEENPEVNVTYTEGNITISDSFNAYILKVDNIPAQDSEGTYLISNLKEFNAFATLIGDLNISGINSVNAKLTADIDATKESEPLKPIGMGSDTLAALKITSTSGSQIFSGNANNAKNPFNGEFDGQNHKITANLESTATLTSVGVFSNITNATVKNLNFYGSVTGTATSTIAGGIVGNVEKTGSAKIINCNNYAKIDNAGNYTGGITGSALKYAAEDSIIESCNNYGEINGKANTGGICGLSSYSNIKNCKNYNNVTGTTYTGGIAGTASSTVNKTFEMTACTNTGNVTGTFNVAGIAGTSSAYSVSQCRNYGEITASAGTATSGTAGIIGTQTGVDLTMSGCFTTDKITGTNGVIKVGKFIGYANANVNLEDSNYTTAGDSIDNIGASQASKTVSDNSYNAPVSTAPREVINVSITKMPKTEYIEQQKFDLSGTEIEVEYANGENETLEAKSIKVDNTDALTAEDNSVNLIATVGNDIFRFPIAITVGPRILESIRVGGSPDKYPVREGESFNPNGMKMTFFYNNGKSESKAVTNELGELNEGFEYTQTPLTEDNNKVTISYTNDDGTFTDSFDVRVIRIDEISQNSDGFYEIKTADDLKNFSIMVGQLWETDCNAILMNDIDASTVDFKPVGNKEFFELATENGGRIVYNKKIKYCGTFDGNGHTINLNITGKEQNTGMGLFAYVQNTTVKDLTITGNVKNTQMASATGGIAAYAEGTCRFINCTNKAVINGGNTTAGIAASCGGIDDDILAENCRNEGNISAAGNAGGIIGSGDHAVANNCTNTGDIYSTLSHVGGITGSGRAIDCLNTGNITGDLSNVGGIVGSYVGSNTENAEFSKLSGCVNTGKVQAAMNAGGIAGMIFVGREITNCYNYGDVSSTKEGSGYGAGGITGIQADDVAGLKISNCYSAGFISRNDNEAGAVIGYTPKLSAGLSGSTNKFSVEDTYYINGTAPSSTGFLASGREVQDDSEAVSTKAFSQNILAVEGLPYKDVQMKALSNLLSDDFDSIIKGKAPVITEEPQAAQYTQNQTAETLKIVASGEKLKYQWFSNSYDNNEKGTAITDATEDTYTPSTSTVGNTYYYCEVSNSFGTIKTECTLITVNPKPVSKVTAKSSDYNAITLSWTKVTGVSGYEIYKYNGTAKKYVLIDNIAGSGRTSKKYPYLNTNQKYSYKVKTYKVTGNSIFKSTYSAAASAKPALKTASIKLAKLKSGKIKISWKKVNGAQKYEVYRAVSKTGKYTKISTVKSPKLYYLDNKKLNKNKKYYYKVRSYRVVKGKKAYSKYSGIKNIRY